MTIFTRLLLAALAGASIGLAKKALARHEQIQGLPGGREAASAPVLVRWARARRGVVPGAGTQPCPLPAFYQVRWVGAPGPGRPAGER